MMFNLSAFDCLTDTERELYNKYHKAKKEDREVCRQEYEDKLMEYNGTRTILESKLYMDNGLPRLNNTIALFESEAARMSEDFKFEPDNPKKIPIVRDFMVFDCTNDIIWKQIVRNGVNIAGEHYIFWSSSANQQKNTQMCVMKEEFFKKHHDRLMNGLSIEIINTKDGCNTGKYLAYNSLIFSQSVQMDEPISIDEVLVLPEFETMINAKVNYLDMDTQIIDERTMPVPVNHMDGAGIFLPGVLPQSAQIRNGYIKGCIFPFDFRQFIIEAQQCGRIAEGTEIKDVWGDYYSVDWIRDNIKVILNRSMLKMWKYYDSWEDYKEAFKRNGLEICINNMLHYPTTKNPLVMSAYQFYQTIPKENMADDRIKKLCGTTVDIIQRYKTDENAVFEIMGIDEDEKELEPFYAAIKTYPAMVQDVSVRKKVKSKIDTIRKKGMSGKPYIKGFYNYICPDLYAACEHWFCGEENPKGLISAGYVYNAFYNEGEVADVEEVCCLRSPHLSDCEHGIRTLIKSDECKRWFSGLDTVISTHDLLTKTLQCDVDGDENLITHDRAFIDLVDRSKLPLYYEMKKAEAEDVNAENIIVCLESSFANSIIGDISNALTKHWNLSNNVNLDFVRVITAYNNFVIDYPKSQYMPVLKPKYKEMFEALLVEKYPRFFMYAKSKKSKLCHRWNEDSNVDRIAKYIMENTSDNMSNCWQDDILQEKSKEDREIFNPEYLQIQDYVVDRSSETYIRLSVEIAKLKKINSDSFRTKLKEKYMTTQSLSRLGYEPFYFYCNHEILKIVEEGYSIAEKIVIRKKAAAYLLDIEYYQPKNKGQNKDILWNCFGDILYDNLCKNVKSATKIRTKRNVYQKASQRAKDIADTVAKTAEEFSMLKVVPITAKELEYIENIKCRKNSERDRYLLYILLVLFKRYQKWLTDNCDKISDDQKLHFKIYKKAKKGKITRATIDKWLDNASITKKGLERLVKSQLIRIEACEEYDKIYLDFAAKIENDETIFSVENKNPMLDYYLYTGERKIGKCEICGNLFVVIGNMKTCGNKLCSDSLKYKTKNRSA